MKNNSYFFLFLSLFFMVSSCNRKGCTDPEAYNYDSAAKADDGSCNFSSIIRRASSGNKINSTSDGGVFMAGLAHYDINDEGDRSTDNNGSFLMKLDGSHGIEWEQPFFSFDHYSTFVAGLSLTDGNFVVANRKFGVTDSSELVCLDESGELRWKNKWGFGVQDIIETADYGLYVLGTFSNNLQTNSPTYSTIAKLDNQGFSSWNITQEDIVAKRIIETPDGGISILGYNDDYRMRIVRYDPIGNLLSSEDYDGQFYPDPSSPNLQIGSENNLIMSYNYLNGLDGKEYVAFYQIDNNGEIEWESILEGEKGFYSSFGELIVTGNDEVRKYSQNGELIWSTDISSGVVVHINEGSNGIILMTGSKTDLSGESKVWHVQVSSSGSVLVDQTY